MDATKKYIRYYNYEHFCGVEEVGSGRLGKVYYADWRSKSSFNLNEAIIEEIVKEVII